jgi:hypothetical protein
MRRKYIGLFLLLIAILLGGSFASTFSAPMGQASTATPTATRTPFGGVTETPTPPFVTAVAPTATATPRGGPKISGVFPCQGATCMDWNLRSGCGNNDLWVKISVLSDFDSLAGYRVEVRDTARALVCERTYMDDNLIVGQKFTYLDEMIDGADAACLSWPTTGIILLYDAANQLIDEREYGFGG